MSDKATPRALHDALVETLKHRGDLVDPRVEAAFRAVPRHLFLPGVPLDVAYADDAVPVKRDSDGSVISSSSQPSMIAAMLAQLRLRPGDNVLEIGAGTGYMAALMQYIVGDSGIVTTMELDQQMVRLASANLHQAGFGRVNVVHADGAMGYAPRASYDRIIATVGIWDVPPAWVQQLKPTGILVAPLWIDSLQLCVAFRCQPDDTLFSDYNVPCGFVRLRGPAEGPQVQKRLGSTSLTLICNAIDRIDSRALQTLLEDDAAEEYLPRRLTAHQYWQGFMPYLMLNYAPDTHFAVYNLMDDVRAFGIEGNGFALIASASACFVPYQGQGKVYTFAGADAYLALQDSFAAWEADGFVMADRMRVQMHPTHEVPFATRGRIYHRPHHDLRVWQEPGGSLS